MARVRKIPGSKYWYAHYHDGISWQRQSTRQTQKKLAQQVADRLESDALDPGRAAARGLNVADAAGAWLSHCLERVRRGDLAKATFVGYQKEARRVVRYWGETLLADVSPVTIDAWLNARLSVVSAYTVTHEKTTMGQILKLARRQGLWSGHVDDVMPVTWKSGYKPGRRWLPTEEADALIAALPEYQARIVDLILGTGAESGPARRALGTDVDLSGCTRFLIRGTKNERRWRWVAPWNHSSGYMARACWYLQQHGQFPRWADGNVSKNLKAACQRAGIEHCTLTDLRRTACVWMRMAGIREDLAVAYMGHAGSSMVRTVYGRIEGAQIRMAHERSK